jgi:hypothetical protein
MNTDKKRVLVNSNIQFKGVFGGGDSGGFLATFCCGRNWGAALGNSRSGALVAEQMRGPQWTFTAFNFGPSLRRQGAAVPQAE